MSLGLEVDLSMIWQNRKGKKKEQQKLPFLTQQEERKQKREVLTQGGLIHPPPRMNGLLCSYQTFCTAGNTGFSSMPNRASPIVVLYLTLFTLLFVQYNWLESRWRQTKCCLFQSWCCKEERNPAVQKCNNLWSCFGLWVVSFCQKIWSSFHNENCFPLNHFLKKNFLSLICCATVSQFDK